MIEHFGESCYNINEKRSCLMNKKKLLVSKLAVFLMAIVPVALGGGKIFIGEPELPVKIGHKA